MICPICFNRKCGERKNTWLQWHVKGGIPLHIAWRLSCGCSEVSQLFNRLFGGVVRKHSTTMNPDGSFTCDDGRGNKFKSDNLLDGIINDKEWERI